jgi:sugar (pentulose or hexulose) kinase
VKLLSVDIGTSSVKAAVLDGAFNILHTANAGYKIKTLNVDWVELEADDVLAAITGAVAGLPGIKDIELVCFDNFSPSFMLMDADGNAMSPILTHLDRRSKRQTQDILKIVGKDRFQAITGIQPFTGGASVTSALWLKENRGNEWAAAARVGHINTFIYKRLAGIWATDPVNASQTGMYETITQGGWSQEICGALGVATEKLPEVMPAGKVAGGLTREFARMWGITEGTPVALGTNDAASAQIGAGNRASGDILNISGSSDMVSILTDKPVVNDKYYTRAFCLPDMWQFYVTTAGGFAVDWFMEQFCRELGGQRFFEEEFETAAQMCTDEDLTVEFTPYLAGDRQSLEPKKASFSGLTLGATRRQMLAALLLAMHGPMRDVLDDCSGFMRFNGTVKLTGGMLSPAFVNLKRRLFPQFTFEVHDDCPLIGSARLATEVNYGK